MARQEVQYVRSVKAKKLEPFLYCVVSSDKITEEQFMEDEGVLLAETKEDARSQALLALEEHDDDYDYRVHIVPFDD